MGNLTYNSCGNCVYAAVKQNDKGFFFFAGTCDKHKKKVSEYDRACRDHIESMKSQLNTFYFCNVYALKERCFFLCVEQTRKYSMGLGGYCKSIESAIEKIPFVPFKFSKKKLAEDFKKQIKNNPVSEIRQVYYSERTTEEET